MHYDKRKTDWWASLTKEQKEAEIAEHRTVDAAFRHHSHKHKLKMDDAPPENQCPVCAGEGKMKFGSEIRDCPECKGTKIMPQHQRQVAAAKAKIAEIEGLIG